MGDSKSNPRLPRFYSLVAHSPDCVELRSGVWNPVSFTLTDESGAGHLTRVLARLDGSLSAGEIAKAEGIPRSEVEGVLDKLVELEVLEWSAGTVLDHYLDSMVPTLAAQSADTAKPRAVLLLGESGVCELIASYLRESIPDADARVLRTGDAGHDAALATDTSWLFDGLEFERKLEVFEDWRDRFVVFTDTVINPLAFRVVNRVCQALGTPWMHAALDGPFVLVGPIFIPRRSSCYECFETRITMNLRESASYQRYKEALALGRVTAGRMPAQPVLAGMLAAHAAMDTLNFVLTKSAFTVEKVLSIYLPTMEFSFCEVLPVPGCPACSPSSRADDRELYFDMTALLPQSLDRSGFSRGRL